MKKRGTKIDKSDYFCGKDFRDKEFTMKDDTVS